MRGDVVLVVNNRIYVFCIVDWMVCIFNGVCFEFKKKVYKLCKKYLGGFWKYVFLEEFFIEELW